MKKFRLYELALFGYYILIKEDYDKLLVAGWKCEPTAIQHKLGFDKPDSTDEDDITYAMRTGACYIESIDRENAIKSFCKATGRQYLRDCIQPYEIASIE
jgi:hypothetical protein